MQYPGLVKNRKVCLSSWSGKAFLQLNTDVKDSTWAEMPKAWGPGKSCSRAEIAAHRDFVCSALFINTAADSMCDREKLFVGLWDFYIFSSVWFNHELHSSEKNNLVMHFHKSNGSYASEAKRIKCLPTLWPVSMLASLVVLLAILQSQCSF